jgi:hypothetical protein
VEPVSITSNRSESAKFARDGLNARPADRTKERMSIPTAKSLNVGQTAQLGPTGRTGMVNACDNM